MDIRRKIELKKTSKEAILEKALEEIQQLSLSIKKDWEELPRLKGQVRAQFKKFDDIDQGLEDLKKKVEDKKTLVAEINSEIEELYDRLQEHHSRGNRR